MSAVRTVMSVRLVPVLLIAWAVLWPVAGYPWWPLAVVGGLAVALRLIGYAAVLDARRGPVLMVGLLVVTTAGAWTPWAAVTSLGACLAGAGLWRLPRWHLLALGLGIVVVAGTGWIAATVITAQHAAAAYQQESDLNRAQLLPRDPRSTLGALMGSAADGDTVAACSLLDPTARAQIAAAAGTTDCAGAILRLSDHITRPDDYTTTNELVGVVVDESRDRETATVTACGLHWYSPITGDLPDAGPSSPGRLTLTRELGQGYRVTGYALC